MGRAWSLKPDANSGSAADQRETTDGGKETELSAELQKEAKHLDAAGAGAPAEAPLEQAAGHRNPPRRGRTQRGFARPCPGAAAARKPCTPAHPARRIPHTPSLRRVVFSPSPAPAGERRSGGRPQGVLRLQRLPGKLLISPGGSRTHLITITGSQHSPHRSLSPSPGPGGPHSCHQQLFLPRDSAVSQPASGPSPARRTSRTAKSPRGKDELCRAAWQGRTEL